MIINYINNLYDIINPNRKACLNYTTFIRMDVKSDNVTFAKRTHYGTLDYKSNNT